MTHTHIYIYIYTRNPQHHPTTKNHFAGFRLSRRTAGKAHNPNLEFGTPTFPSPPSGPWSSGRLPAGPPPPWPGSWTAAPAATGSPRGWLRPAVGAKGPLRPRRKRGWAMGGGHQGGKQNQGEPGGEPRVGTKLVNTGKRAKTNSDKQGERISWSGCFSRFCPL